MRIVTYAILFLLFVWVLHGSHAIKTRNLIGLTKEFEGVSGCTIFKLADSVAVFKGSRLARHHFLEKHLNYTDAAIAAHVQGIMRCQFVIATDGKVTAPTIMKGLGYGLDEAVLRVMAAMPNWKPAVQDGRNIAYRVVQSIRFKF